MESSNKAADSATTPGARTRFVLLAPHTLAAVTAGDPIVDGQRPAEGNAAYRTRGGQEWPFAD
jgi:hypothetical protein